MNYSQAKTIRNVSLRKPLGLVSLSLSSFLVARMMAPHDSFAGKVVVITGGSRGLGLALARRLAQENAKLAILARDQQELVDAKSDLEKHGSTVTTWTCDVKNDSSVRSTIEEIASVLGGIDVLINNAGEIDPLLESVQCSTIGPSLLIIDL